MRDPLLPCRVAVELTKCHVCTAPVLQHALPVPTALAPLIAPHWPAFSPCVWLCTWLPSQEHQRFLEGLKQHGRKNLKAISEFVKTRTPLQVCLESKVEGVGQSLIRVQTLKAWASAHRFMSNMMALSVNAIADTRLRCLFQRSLRRRTCGGEGGYYVLRGVVVAFASAMACSPS